MAVDAAFAEIGARVRVRQLPVRPGRSWSAIRAERLGFSPARLIRQFPILDVRNDAKGEFFTIAVPKGVEMEVIDTDAEARHLLLMARLDANDKAKYLCGHDERHWFVAAVPESSPASTVEEAKLALQPNALREATARLPKGKRIARHNEVFRRQGEWFFVPEPDFEPGPKDIIMRNEPLRRDGRSKPHIVAEAVRSGGEVRYVPETTNRGFTHNPVRAREIDKALGNRSAMTKAGMERLAAQYPEVLWRSVIVNPTMFVRGPVRHSDHSTLNLKGWHRVVMNSEALARSAAGIAFID